MEIGKTTITRPFVKGLLKIGFRVSLWILLLIIVFFATILTLGYFAASKPVTYLPEIPANELKLNSNSLNKTGLKNSRYVLIVNEDGGVIVKTIDGDIILSNLKYFASYEGTNEKWGLDNISLNVTSDSTVSILGGGPLGAEICILLTVPKDKPRLDVNIRTHYTLNTVVRRESLVAGFDVSVSEIYKKNRQVDAEAFNSEYWLQRQGVRFGTGYRSALIYHTPFVSSLQLDTERNLLFVNLEYYLDHPFFNIPFQKDGSGRWIDLSKSKYNAGDERINNFSIYFGGIPEITPRIMLVPNGYLAGYVFTEHADGGNIRTHRAAYFGSEDISTVADAVGGFAGHKIPVTKSVFFGDIVGHGDSLLPNNSKLPQFLNFLDQICQTGDYDICLHGSNSNLKLLEESIKFMKDRFDAATWIDHGMFSGADGRESFVCDGLNPDSEYYTADLWEKYKTKYFWNSSVEELRKFSLKEKIVKLRLVDASLNLWNRYFSPEELNKMRFYEALNELVKRFPEKRELNSLLPNKGNAFPTPLYWQNITWTKNFYSWVTDYFKVFISSEEGVKDELKRLNKLIKDRGVFINHGYFVRNFKIDGVLSNSDGKMVINPYFDKILELMAQMRDEGDLYITTIRDIMDYWVLVENVSFDYMPDGVIYINNMNDNSINGFSLVVQADSVTIDGEIPKLRRVGENAVFWFDIAARQRVKMVIE